MTTRDRATELYTQFSGDVIKLLKCARHTGKPVIVAHRGGFAPGFPENALASFERTIANAPVMLEIDIVSSADGVDFLHHDKYLQRTTSGIGLVANADWETIRHLKMRDNAQTITDYTPASFSDALAILRGRAFLMLDLKTPSSTAKIVNMIKDAGVLPGTIFIAYNYNQAAEIRRSSDEALIALGASNLEQLRETKISGFFEEPYVALTGAINTSSKILPLLKDTKHYVLGSAYFGQNPPDARLTTDATVPEFETAGPFGYQLVVSNRPLQAAKYMQDRGVHLVKNLCTSID